MWILKHSLNNTAHKLLLTRLVWGESLQQTQYPCFAGKVRFKVCFLIDVHEVDAQIRARASLTGFEQHQSTRGEEIDGGGPIAGFDISVGNGTELLVGFVEFALFDSGEREVGVSGGSWWW